MQLKSKNILLISPENWNHIFVSKHHYATHLSAMGAHVVFANPPGKKWQLNSTQYPGVQILDYPKFVKGLRKMPTVLAKKLIRYRLEEIEAFTQISFDIIWSFDNSVFFDFSELNNTFNISHIVDLNQDFETAKAASTADLCLYTTPYIGQRLNQWNQNCHFIHHGYNEKGIGDPVVLPGENKIKLLYAGNLNMPYIDWGILLESVEKFPNIDFVFLGPDQYEKLNSEKKEMLANPNVFSLGKIDAHYLQSYYQAADALIICYQENYHLDQANPHKMMEYLGSGKTIIASWTECFANHADEMILMKPSNNEFTSLIKKFIADNKYYNSKVLNQRRKEFASKNTYVKQIEKIEGLINSIINA